MRRPYRLIFASMAAWAAASSGAAHAESLGDTSTGTVSIRVVIQPLGSALAAATEFSAGGLWTFAGSGPGLLVSLPASTTEGGTAELSLIAQTVAPLTVRSDPGGVAMPATTASYDGQLSRRRVNLGAINLDDLKDRNSRLFIIGTV